jgi:outer membrane biosynthesis protein TonB
MPTPLDDTDDILRAAMKTLDDETPSGYFDALPNRTLARLEGSMQTTSSGMESKTEMPQTPTVKDNDRDEDSGLHDIRNLASSQRQRLSSRRLGTNPPPVDEDILASTSGSWKSIALPEPAKMVALPDIADLPSKIDIKAQQKAEKLAAKEAARSRKISQNDIPMAAAPSTSSPSLPMAASSSGGGLGLAVNATVTDAPLHLVEETIPTLAAGTAKGALAAGTAKGATSAAVATPMIGARIAGVQSEKKSRGALIGVLGLGLAAAAGAIIYVATRGDDQAVDTAASAQPEPTLRAKAADEPKPQPAAVPAVVEPIKEEPKVDESKVVAPDPVPVDPPTAKTPAKPAKPAKKPEKQILKVDDPGNGVKPVEKKEEPKKEPPKEGDPDFEQLLKDSGYQKKQDKPKLEKKSLSGGDFKTGMATINGRAQACYKGTQGTARVKLTIAPSGQVTKVAVTGVGAAEAACVQAAVQGAKFPPWDGGPQSFGYSYLLSE